MTVLWRILQNPLELSIEWAEAGVPVITRAPRRIGFGREYIESALTYELDARTSFELRPGGLFCQVNVPMGFWNHD
ncbi:hypothetical protein NOVOSPHI9U_170009 [Novosphingobium sp. 9U]|nr:hypothetical protein NOVOSPHI9U_170009 [Novosphingobium sp. 9U]